MSSLGEEIAPIDLVPTLTIPRSSSNELMKSSAMLTARRYLVSSFISLRCMEDMYWELFARLRLITEWPRRG